MAFIKNEGENAAFDALKNYFEGDRKAYNIFISKLPEEDKSKFINCGVFYNEAELERSRANIRFIMILSIIEEINSKEDFIDFKEWCDQQKNMSLDTCCSFKQLLECLKDKYHKMHGSKQKTLTFFESYVSDEDKNKLIDSLKTEKTSGSDDKLNLNDVVNIIYQMRNNFLHSARFIPIHEDRSIQGYIKRNGKDIFVGSNLTIKEFEEIFERAFIMCFKEKQMSEKSRNSSFPRRADN